jgi:hypothetical protein
MLKPFEQSLLCRVKLIISQDIAYVNFSRTIQKFTMGSDTFSTRYLNYYQYDQQHSSSFVLPWCVMIIEMYLVSTFALRNDASIVQ